MDPLICFLQYRQLKTDWTIFRIAYNAVKFILFFLILTAKNEGKMFCKAYWDLLRNTFINK